MSEERQPTDPDTASVSSGHEADEHLGSLKPPLYDTSTFVFDSAEAGKKFFEIVFGLEGADRGADAGYLYSRLDNPNLRVPEVRVAAWEETEEALVFTSGMAAINTVFLNYLRPGDLILYSTPVYGGTAKVLDSLYTDIGIETATFDSSAKEQDLNAIVDGRELKMVYVETPANPTNDIFDLEMASRVATSHGALLVVDNTFLSPIWQKPVRHGADLIIHSATKYLGGHSDLTAGVVCGSVTELEELRRLRYRLGTTASPGTAWMLGRSLETLRLRVERQTDNAIEVAAFLKGHRNVASVNHLSLLGPDDPRSEIYARQCLGPGAMIAFEVVGGEPEAFRFLNGMELVNLATSLGGTESLASHPWTTSHSTMSEADKKAVGVTEGLIRFSVGVENANDLIDDLETALNLV